MRICKLKGLFLWKLVAESSIRVQAFLVNDSYIVILFHLLQIVGQTGN